MAEDRDPFPVATLDNAANGNMRSTRQQRRAAARATQDMNREQRAAHLRRLTFLQGPVSRQEIIAAFEKLEQDHEDKMQKAREAWTDLRMAFNTLSIQHTALMRALFGQRVWGKPVLTETDYQAMLKTVEEEIQQQMEQAAALRAQAATVPDPSPAPPGS